jgi:hypothetical protein
MSCVNAVMRQGTVVCDRNIVNSSERNTSYLLFDLARHIKPLLRSGRQAKAGPSASIVPIKNFLTKICDDIFTNVGHETEESSGVAVNVFASARGKPASRNCQEAKYSYSCCFLAVAMENCLSLSGLNKRLGFSSDIGSNSVSGVHTDGTSQAILTFGDDSVYIAMSHLFPLSLVTFVVRFEGFVAMCDTEALLLLWSCGH